MEKITNIEIKNFKSIRHQKIDGCKRINVFVGKPNVGKSNILEVLALLAYTKFLHQDEKPPNLKDLCRYENAADLFFDADIQNDIELIYEELLIRFTYINSGELDFSVNPKGTNGFKFTDEHPSNILNYKIDKDGNPIFPINRISEILKFPVKKYQLKLNGFDKKSNPNKLNYSSGSNLFEVLRYNADLRKEIGKLFQNYGLKIIFDKDGIIKIQKQLDEYTATQLPYSQIADTLQRLIFYKAAVKTNSNSVLLFEEPESHMYPPYISKFTSDIIFDENDNQYFIATHSPYVLNDFMEDAKDELSIYLVDYKNGETIVHRLDDEEMHIAYQFGYDFFMNIENFIPSTAHEKV